MCVCVRAFVPGDAGGAGADHQGSGHEAVFIGPAEEQTARPQLLGDPAPAAVGADEPGRLSVSAHHVSFAAAATLRLVLLPARLDLTLLLAGRVLSPVLQRAAGENSAGDPGAHQAAATQPAVRGELLPETGQSAAAR